MGRHRWPFPGVPRRCGQTISLLEPRPAMKSVLFPILVAAASASIAVRGQGTMFVYDQQSATNRTIGPFGAAIEVNQPMGQAFTPSLSGIAFVQIEFLDVHPTNGLGATVFVNLLADSITGTVLGTTAPVSMPDSFAWGINNFFFPTLLAWAPGTTYNLQPVVQSGDDLWSAAAGPFGYTGGALSPLGPPRLDGLQLWFREGVVTPEPSSVVLVLVGAGLLVYARRKCNRMRSRV